MTNSAETSRLRTAIVVILLLVANGAMVHWYWTLYRDMGMLNIAWTRSSQATIERAAHLAQIERTIGYGEFIHNFKNYVLRRTDVYEQRTAASLAKLDQAIEAMLEFSMSAEDREDVLVIEQTVDAYRKNFERAKEVGWRGLSAHELDELVKVDDGPAVEAFEAIRGRLLPTFQANLLEHRRQIDSLWQGVAVGALVAVPLMLINCLFIVWGGLRLIARRRRNVPVS
ncbi:hypothetical protein ACFO5Q_16265 [Kordiimonas lipolytica]|uniref:Four helix bundle sensory module for signal transduction n=1 Tax=Kordiimonas lipolytica TaxID=1662421 RepID=A0ABV8UG03_9PROT|nr:hypothetical protein [Kordiimonas lipolytica]